MGDRVVPINVNCPDCGNENRKARRACKRNGGMCGGTGIVVKYVPVYTPNELMGKLGHTVREKDEDA